MGVFRGGENMFSRRIVLKRGADPDNADWTITIMNLTGVTRDFLHVLKLTKKDMVIIGIGN